MLVIAFSFVLLLQTQTSIVIQSANSISSSIVIQGANSVSVKNMAQHVTTNAFSPNLLGTMTGVNKLCKYATTMLLLHSSDQSINRL